MSKRSKNHNRKSIRLKGYDYAQEGLYFITFCTHNRACLFGNIKDGKMILNDAGQIADECWIKIPEHFPNVVLHEYVIMPNHIHGIIEIVVGANKHSPPNNADVGANKHSPCHFANKHSPLRSPSKTIGSIIRGYKLGVIKWFRLNGNFENIWQRNYWDRIVRDEQSYIRISNYIINNPKNWTKDEFKGL